MRIYYGWIVVALCGVIMMLTMGTTVGVFGLYVLPVAEDFGLSRADVNTGFAINNLGGMLLAPLIGRAADTFPVRRVMAFCMACYVIAFIGLGLSHNLWLSSALLAFAMPFVIGGIASFGAMTLVARWFEAQRARALALAIIGMSLGSVVMAPIVGWLIAEYGWRNALIGQGIVIGTLFFVLLALLRGKPGRDDIEPQPKGAAPSTPLATATSSSGPLSTKQLLRIPAFRVLAFGMALGMGTFQAVTVSLIPMAQEAGDSVGASAALISVMGIAGIIGKFGVAVIGDRVDKPMLAAVMLVLTGIVVALLPVPTSPFTLFVLACLVGLIAGSLLPLFMATLADVVGASSFASANGMASLLIAFVGAITLRLSGDLYDMTGTYHALFVTLGAAYVGAALLMVVVSRMRRSSAGDQTAAA